NQAIALMNRQLDGDEADALSRFDAMAAEQPDALRVRYCAGLLEFRRGELARAAQHLDAVLQVDPDDPHAAYFMAQSLQQRGDNAAALSWYQRALETDPYMRSAYYALAQVHRQQGQADEARRYLALYQRLADNPRAQLVEFKYTRMGPKCEAATVGEETRVAAGQPDGPLYAEPIAPLQLAVPTAVQQAGRSSMTVADINADGRADLFLAGRAAGDAGHNAVLLGQSDGTFVSDHAHPLTAVPDVNTALWGDFDNDGHTDVYLCRRGANQLWQQTAAGQWQDVTGSTQTAGGAYETVDGAMFDADHDGELDLFLVNGDGPDELLNNNLDGTFRPLAAARGLDGGDTATRQVLLLDIDNDRDTDIITLKAAPPHAVYINELGWKYTPAGGPAAFTDRPLAAIVSGDNDADGEPELYGLGEDGRVLRWRPTAAGDWHMTELGSLPPAMQPRLELRDVNGDGQGELLASGAAGIAVYALSGDTLTAVQELGAEPLQGWASVVGDIARGPALAALDGDNRLQVWPPGAGRHAFIGLAPTGRSDSAATMRSNASGIGTRLALRRGSDWVLTDSWRR
ncbi:MAG: FG-GAP-like repeat-containing protein, partial [Thiohalobacterales bacterium]|nr:FG-GAP-like repeat-containing protein [Thiohalobacterales bacterium]